MLAERTIYFFVIVILTLIGLVWGLMDSRRVIEAPFLYATGMALILCPQLYVAASDSARVPDQAFWVFNAMVILCTIALYWGYFSKPERQARKGRRPAVSWPINQERLYRFGLGCALLGLMGAYQLNAMGTITEWRGWAVYWLNILAFLVPGITLMLIAYVLSPSTLRLVPIVLLSLIPISWITDSGRRSATLTLPLVYILPFMLYKKHLRVPRWGIIAGFLLAFIVVYAFPVWRGQFKEHDYSQSLQDNALSDIVKGTFISDSSKPLEIADGMIVTGARYQFGRYEFGVLDIYNQLVQNYVPGSLLWYDFKYSLRVGQGVNQDWVTEAYGIPVHFYTAKSGYADLFSQFSFFGCIVLYWVGKGFRKAHDAAVFFQDGRAVIFLCFFISFPASIAYRRSCPARSWT